MKKEHLILAVIITAAVVGVVGFIAGSLLTRSDRTKVKTPVKSPIDKAFDEYVALQD